MLQNADCSSGSSFRIGIENQLMHQYGSINTECGIAKYYIENKPDRVADILVDTTGLADKVNCFDDAYVQPIWEES
jgi:hypothetical protein